MSSFEPTPTASTGLASGFVALPLAHVDGSFDAESPTVLRPSMDRPATDVESIRREAYEAGRAAGRAELPWSEAEALRTALAALEDTLRSLTALRRGYLVDNRMAVVDLAFAIAEQVLGRAVRTRRDTIVELLARALPLAGDADVIHVHLATSDLEALRSGEAPALTRFVEEHGLTTEADDALSPGESRILAGRTRVDARLGEVLRRLREDIAEIAESAEDDA